jgi:nucleoside-diphosphate-sugar epimerase
MKQKPMLITGATGFLGRHLLQKLHDNHPEIRSLALVRNRATWEELDWTGDLEEVELLEGSVTHPESWQDDSRLRELGGIFHLAAVIRHTRKEPEAMWRTNVEGLLHMIRLASRYHCRVVYISTSGTVGCFKKPEQWADEEAPYCENEVGDWPYYASKIEAERRAIKLANQLGVELVILRPPVLLGPGDHRHRATGHIQRLMKGKLPFILNGGMHFVDVRDVVPAMIQAMERPNPKPIYHLTGTECSIPEFFKMVGEVAGVAPPKVKLPPYLAKMISGAASQLENLLSKKSKSALLPDPVVFEMASKYWGLRSRWSEAELNYHSRDPKETLIDTVKWLKKNS